MSGGSVYFAFCTVVCGSGSLYGWFRWFIAKSDREYFTWLLVAIAYGVFAAISANLAVTWNDG